MLELADVHSYYGESHVLHGVSLKVEAGSVVALLGRNGMGKTTTVHSVMGLVTPRRGAVRFKGKEITGLAPYKIARLGLGLVPQGRRIFPSLSVRENLLLSMRGKGYSLDQIYSYFGVLKQRMNNKGNQLSGGEQQMLAIARALLGNPELVLMDEPSEGLAPLLIQQVGDIILRLKSEGLSIFLVEQNVPLALKVSDYVYVLHKGQVVYHSSPAELTKNERVLSEYVGVASRKMTPQGS